MRHLTSTLLTIAISPWLARCATISNSSYEVDIISPTAGGRYRVNTDRGIAVVIAVQNPRAAELYGWRFSWQVRSVANKSEGEGYPGQSSFFDLGGIGRDDGHSLYARYEIQKDERLFVGLTHFYLYDDKPDKPMPAGEYVFSWAVKTGPTCYRGPSGSGFNAIGDGFGSGQFNFTVAIDAPWPDLEPTTCASAAGMASFSPTPSYYESWRIPTTTPLACAGTMTVTESADPCLATIGLEQARRISSIMTWDDKPPTLTTSFAAPTTTTSKESSGGAGMSSLVLSSYLRHIIGGLFTLLAFIVV